MFPLPIEREDLITALASFGAELPKDTKMPVDVLQKLTAKALNYSQQFDELFALKPNTKLNPNSFQNWTGNESLTTAMHVVSMEEAVLGSSAPLSQLKKGARAPKENIFTELRQSVMGLGYAMDMGKNRVYFTGENNDWLIELRIVSVQKVDDRTPMFVVNYKHEEKQSGDALAPTPGYTPVVISDLERRLLLALWDMNRARLDSAFQAKAKSGYKASIVLPLGSIGMKELGELTGDTGCAVCGKRSYSRCIQCQSVTYCGKECQRADWPNHKTECTSLKGATWHKVTFSDLPGAYYSSINRKDPLSGLRRSGATETASEEGPPCGKVFLAKFQTPLGGGSTILVYDRQRSFTKNWVRKNSPDAFRLAEREAVKSGIPKIYRWTRRIEGNDYEVCLDRAPAQVPVW
ncbi:hypothetical protein CVT24_013065 [Panaeolus cyanescens]|uniref:MYND-type domain-containing protein n=1 Tax=Panaeolus cyanescens TaxID=181874 RepID=A0A409YUP9_9AGAR|nr:hypothetical protein CVT24_013065 [Panaeolus cyanescens]